MQQCETEYRFLTNQDLDKLRAGSQYISKARWDALDFSASKRRRQNWRDYAMCHSVSTEDFEKALARPSTDPLRERPIIGEMPKLAKPHQAQKNRQAKQQKRPPTQTKSPPAKPKLSYEEYLKTPLWKAIRNLVLVRSNFECCCCSRKATQVHHQDYSEPTKSGFKVDTLHAICGEHHIEIEFENGVKNSTREANKKLFALIKAKDSARPGAINNAGLH